MTKNLKPLFLWAKERGDANIYDRILIKIIPVLLKENIHLTTNNIDSSDTIEVSQEVYDFVLIKTQELVNELYKETL